MERPIARLHQGRHSEILISWFCIEAAKEDDFDKENNLKGLEGVEGPRERNSQLPMKLKRLQKVTDRDIS